LPVTLTFVGWSLYKIVKDARFVCFFFWAQQPPVGQGVLIHEVSRSQTTTHHSRQDSSGRVISSSQRPDNTRHSEQTNIHAPGGIRTHNLSRRAAADLRLRPRGHWDRQKMHGTSVKILQFPWYKLLRYKYSLPQFLSTGDESRMGEARNPYIIVVRKF